MFSARTALLLLGLATLATTALAKIQYSDVGMLCLVNKERRKQGLKPLGLDPKLTEVARKHSQDQARTRKMSHTGSDGSRPSQRVSRSGFKWKSTAENVAYGYKSMEEVMRVWMKSPGHRKNILTKDCTMFGSGVAYAGNTPYFTQSFASDGKGSRNVPKCDGSDSGDYGNDMGGDAYGDDMGGDDYGSSKGGNDYGSSKGGDDYGSSKGGDDYGSSKGGNDYGSSKGGDDYGSSKGGRKGGRKGGKGGKGGNKEDCKSKKGRGGNNDSDYSGGNDNSDYGSDSGKKSRGGRRSGGDKKSRGGRRSGGGSRGGDY